ncbi:MAG: hypothetical protein IJ803_03615 [Oribacterium sp.]|nr:hypothetical protein [Oribacterium sp.]
MSDIPLGKRPESKLKLIDEVYDLRKRITFELEQSFGFSQKILESRINEQIKRYPKNQREEVHDRILEMEIEFGCWFIERERDRVADHCCGIVTNLKRANAIVPMYMSEYELRRALVSDARSYCAALEDELQYIAESIPADKNKFTKLQDKVSEMFNKITSLRKSDNRFLKGIEARASSVSASNFANVNSNGNANYNNASNSNGVRPDFLSAQDLRKGRCSTKKGDGVRPGGNQVNKTTATTPVTTDESKERFKP